MPVPPVPVSVEPLLAEMNRRYCLYAVVLATSYVLVWNRAVNAWFVWAAPTSDQLAPSLDPWSWKFLGSRAGASLALVMRYCVTT